MDGSRTDTNIGDAELRIRHALPWFAKPRVEVGGGLVLPTAILGATLAVDAFRLAFAGAIFDPGRLAKGRGGLDHRTNLQRERCVGSTAAPAAAPWEQQYSDLVGMVR